MITAEEVGTSLVILSLVFFAAGRIRRFSPFLRSLFIPTAVIGGFLVLLLGPEGLGRITDDAGLFSEETFAVWESIPGLMINVMCAALLLGERLPPMRNVWSISSQHAAIAFMTSFGQFAVGALLTVLILRPFFDSSPLTGALMEVSYAGGHGTVAGLSGLFEQEGAADLVDLGLTLATIGLLSAVVIGTLAVNYAVRSPTIPIARLSPTTPEDDYDIDFHKPRDEDPPMDENRGMTQVSAAAVTIGVAIAIGMVMLYALRWLAGAAGSDIFENFPLFPFTIIGGVLVQLAAVRFQFEWAVNRRAVEGLGGIAVDLIVVCAIGTLSISALGDNIAPLIVLAIGSIVWSVFVLFILGPRLFATHWFERSVAEFGETQGNVATGFMMVDMVDPARTTDVASAYSYRQLITRPLVGGGFISAISVPFLIEAGLTAFAIVSVVLTAAMGFWAFRQVGNAS